MNYQSIHNKFKDAISKN